MKTIDRRVDLQIRDEAKRKVMDYFRCIGVRDLVPEGEYLFDGKPGFIFRKDRHFEISMNLFLRGNLCIYLYSYDEDRNIDKKIRKELPVVNREGVRLAWNDRPRANAQTGRHICDFHRDMNWRCLSEANLKTLSSDYKAIVSALESIGAFS